MRCLCFLLFLIPLSFFSIHAFAAESLEVSATKEEIVFKVQRNHPLLELFELRPGETAKRQAIPLAAIPEGKRKLTVARFDRERDRLYAGFFVGNQGSQTGPVKFVQDFENISLNSDAYPKTKSKKGLQVQMIDDAIALGVKHAALNFNFGQMVALTPVTNDFEWRSDGRVFHFSRGYIEGNDSRVKALSDTGALVSLILLNYENADTNLNKILLHPNYDASCPNKLSAFNTSTPEGAAWFKACMEFLANRYSAKGFPHGRVVNYIVGNEVNSHWYWANMGKVSMQQFAEDYLRTVRLCNAAVRKFSTSARVFISLEHHWSISFDKNPEQTFPGREFIDYFNQLAKEQGNFDWNLAFHPYPENLFQPRTWNDKSATFNDDTPRITFKNLELLTEYFRRKELRFEGKPRHIILSEQGFHSDGTPEGELAQAAGYAYAYYKINRLDGIDAFILHRHVDHPHEGGLNLGLWRRDPMSKKPIYEVFRAADTPEWEKAFEFALPIIGIKSWKEIEPRIR